MAALYVLLTAGCFNLKTGKQPTGARGLDSYQVKIIDDEVFAIVKAKELKW